jgi:creatinine amidohydrolase/Fe(II)-dependent formamide hydrolase-like protein
MRRFYLDELIWPDVEEFLSDHDVVVGPARSCDQHGPHLPLDTDAYDVFFWLLKGLRRRQVAL